MVRRTFNPTAWRSAKGDTEEEALNHLHRWNSLQMKAVDSVQPPAAEADGARGASLAGTACHALRREAVRLPAFFIANVLMLIESVPFGLSFFHAAWENFPVPRALGIQMFLLSTAICQAVLAVQSKFDMATGLMMCENIPFMQQISMDTYNALRAQGRETEALPTVLFVYAVSSVIVGVAFYALGMLRLGSVIGLIPPFIIQGCIGGIGIFLVQTGVEISTGIPFRWRLEVLSKLATGPVAPMWLLAVGLSVALRVLSRFVSSPMLTPVFFGLVAPVFHLVLLALGRPFPHGGAWFFPAEETPDWKLMWQTYDFGAIAWDVLPSQLGTIAALTLFSLIHVPINIPSLSMTTDQVADVDQELKAHGVSNLLAGCVGTLQNYLCYSNSALYFKCGGGGLFLRGRR